jgi:hypothetical protein
MEETHIFSHSNASLEGSRERWLLGRLAALCGPLIIGGIAMAIRIVM